jgi:DNA-directed RNA polymerase subunit M/transcription elongation factor TFIIS
MSVLLLNNLTNNKFFNSVFQEYFISTGKHAVTAMKVELEVRLREKPMIYQELLELITEDTDENKNKIVQIIKSIVTNDSIMDHPDIWKSSADNFDIEVMQIKEGQSSLAPVIHSITCSRCSKNNIVVKQLQTRSADEGATTFYSCLDCGKKWRDD